MFDQCRCKRTDEQKENGVVVVCGREIVAEKAQSWAGKLIAGQWAVGSGQPWAGQADRKST
jgi:hypothetical protein